MIKPATNLINIYMRGNPFISNITNTQCLCGNNTKCTIYPSVTISNNCTNEVVNKNCKSFYFRNFSIAINMKNMNYFSELLPKKNIYPVRLVT